MKKSWIILLGPIISLFLIVLVSAEVRINEVMADPSACYNDKCEYIEIYTDTSINLTNWTINATKEQINFNFYLEDYLIITPNKTIFLNNFFVNNNKVIELSKISLSNSGDGIFLFNNDYILISNFSYSSTKTDKSFQFCSGNWLERNPTPATENNCSTTQINPPQNNTQNPIQNNNSNQKTLISLNIDWNDDEIINGDEFDIKVNAKNLKNQKYNFKIWIREEDEETVISDRYGEDSSEKEVWKSGNYYIYNLFKGPGDKTETVKLRIREDYSDFSGDAEICFKIEDANEKCEAIEILEKKEEIKKNNTEKIKTITKSSESTNSITGNVIKLGGSESKETITNNPKNINSNVIYESKNEKIKIYAIIGFAVLCLGLVILLLFKKLN